MTRKTALVLAKVAGYHSDSKTFTRLIIEAHVNRQAMNEAWHVGVLAKQNGIRCECYECKKQQEAA